MDCYSSRARGDGFIMMRFQSNIGLSDIVLVRVGSGVMENDQDGFNMFVRVYGSL